MKQHPGFGMALAGIGAGSVNGLFGAGGGMVLVPMLNKLTDLEDDQIFPSSIGVILPVCAVSLTVSASHAPLPWAEAVPYLLGGLAGGFLAVKFEKKIPVMWLHRVLGILILWGGIRYLC